MINLTPPMIGVLLAASSVIVFGSRFAYKMKLFHWRERLLLKDMYGAFSVVEGGQVSYDSFEETYSLLSKAFRVDIQKIRPEDPMKMYFDLDSWYLDFGAELIHKTLLEKYQYAEINASINSVADLIRIINNCKQRR